MNECYINTIVEEIIVKGIEGETLDYILNTPDSSLSSTELGLDLSLRTEDGKVAPSGHFVLLYGDEVIANSETNNEGIVHLWPTSSDSTLRLASTKRITEAPKQYTLQWREPSEGHYKVKLQWKDLKNNKDFNPTEIRYIIDASAN